MLRKPPQLTNCLPTRVQEHSSSGRRSHVASNGSISSNGSAGSGAPHAASVAGRASSGKQSGSSRREIRARLLVDCCGHYSPIVKQMRGGAKPQAMVLVVGSCADGVPLERNR